MVYLRYKLTWEGNMTRAHCQPIKPEVVTGSPRGMKRGSHYLGRRKLLKVILGRNKSTRIYILKALREDLRPKPKPVDKTAPFKALAKRLGVRIRSISLR